MRTKNIIYIGVLVAQAMVLYTIERMIPAPFMIPGAKLGLANLIVVIALYTLNNYKECMILIGLKLILSTLIMGSFSTFLFGLGGTVLSFFSMILVKEFFKDRVSAIGVSSVGGVFHNIGQLLVAAFIIKNMGIMVYLPFLSLVGICTGVFIGFTGNYILKHMKKIDSRRNEKLFLK